ncbi:unnamed protein product [Wickerhamomyces anomalus]
MTLHSYLHSTLTTLLSPQKQSSSTPIETDYELSPDYEDSTHSISDPPPQPTTTIEISNDFEDDRDKIRQFINVKQTLLSLRNLEKLITDPNVNYEGFKKTYIESSMGLLNSIQDRAELQTLSTGTTDQSRDYLIRIGLVSVQIFVVLMDLFTPLFIQFTVMWRQVLNNDLVQKNFEYCGGVDICFVDTGFGLFEKVSTKV